MSTGNFNFPSTSGGGGGGVPTGDTITPYVVSSDGTYNTIQAAVDAAELAGGGLVWIRPGTYTEDVSVSLDDVFLEGPESGAVVIVGEMSLNGGDGAGDASDTHKLGLRNLTLLAGAGDTTVLSISGNPQEVFLDGVVVDAGAGATDGVNFDVSGGVLHLRDTKVTARSGGSGVPFTNSSGESKFYSGCEVGLVDADSVALSVTLGAITVYDQILIRGTVQNQSIGNGSYAALIQEAYIVTNNVSAFDAQGSGAFGVYRAVVSDESGLNPDVGSGGGTFFWSGLEVHVSGYSNVDFPSANAASGAISLNGVEYAGIRQVDVGGSNGQVLTNQGGGLYGWADIPGVAAPDVTYTPGDAGDWDPNPTTVAEGLDDLASRVGSAGGGVALVTSTVNTDPAGVGDVIVFNTLSQSTGLGVSLASNTITLPAGGFFLCELSIGGRVTSSAGYIEVKLYDVTGGGAVEVSDRAQFVAMTYNGLSMVPSNVATIIDTTGGAVEIEARVSAQSSNDYITGAQLRIVKA